MNISNGANDWSNLFKASDSVIDFSTGSLVITGGLGVGGALTTSSAQAICVDHSNCYILDSGAPQFDLAEIWTDTFGQEHIIQWNRNFAVCKKDRSNYLRRYPSSCVYTTKDGKQMRCNMLHLTVKITFKDLHKLAKKLKKV